MSDKIVYVSDDTFEKDVLKSDKLVLLDLWAEWCGPCRAIGPLMEELAKEYEGRVTIAKLNVDENPVTPGNYGVRGIPTLIVFKDGAEVDRIVGAGPKNIYTDMIERHL
ncbi:MAG: thioredoxin TrxA [Myxococcota bacterium]